MKVVTINILADLSLWEERRPLLVKGLSEIRPDILALQEVNLRENVAVWLAEKLDLPHIHISPKSGNAGDWEGIAILSRFPLERHATLDLRYQNRVAQVVQIQSGSQPVLFANGHFYWQPGESDKRLGQVERFQEWLAEAAARLGDPAIVVCGDFNALPEYKSIQKMRSRFTSAYAAIHGREPEYTSPTPLPVSKLFMLRTGLDFLGDIDVIQLLTEFRKVWKGTLDYLFVNERLRVIDCQLVLNSPAPDNPRIYPSDHLGLAADLEIIQ